MNKAQTVKVIASMRDQVLDVRIGVTSPAEWVERYDDAAARGVTFPAQLAAIRAEFAKTI